MPEPKPGASLLLQAVERRGDTDERPAYGVHVVLPLVLVILGPVIGLGLIVATSGYLATLRQTILAAPLNVYYGALVIAAAGILAGFVLFEVGLYRIMRRRNAHFARDEKVREGLLAWARHIAGSGEEDRPREHVEAMERIHTDAAIDEPDRSPATHLVLGPLLFWYVLYYLLKDFALHARRQARFFREADALAGEAGLEDPSVEAVPSINERSYLLALALLPLVPVGPMVVLYWLYNDPEEHFDQQWRHEDAFVEIVAEEETEPLAGGPSLEEAMAPDEPGDEDASEVEAEEAEPPGAQTDAEDEEEAEDASDTEEETEEAEPPQTDDDEPDYTVWSCPECSTRFKVPPKRPVRVTCKNCDNDEILEE